MLWFGHGFASRDGSGPGRIGRAEGAIRHPLHAPGNGVGRPLEGLRGAAHDP